MVPPVFVVTPSLMSLSCLKEDFIDFFCWGNFCEIDDKPLDVVLITEKSLVK